MSSTSDLPTVHGVAAAERQTQAPLQAMPAEQPTQAVAAPPTQAAVAAEQRTQVALSQLPLSAATPPPPMPFSYDLAPGLLVGEYRVLRRLGEGGMGAVYAAEHPLIGRKVAIKVLNAGGSSNEGAAQRFLQEARAASRVQHRNIVDVFAFGQLQDGRSYLIMEFLEGQTLSGYLQKHGPLPFSHALPILQGVCAGLRAAHDRGVIHRDLKPDNIWICADPMLRSGGAEAKGHVPADQPIDPLSVKLLDFGLAKLFADNQDQNLTRAGMTMGTPAYMSPEQCRGARELDQRSDIYALGIILFQLFCGHVPFSGEAVIDVMNHHLRTPPPSLVDEIGMPPELFAIIQRALAKAPEDRQDDVGELWRELSACEDARGFVPSLRGASVLAMVAGAPPVVPDDEDAGPTLRAGGLAVRGRRDGAGLRLGFSGELTGEALDDLSAFLERLSREEPPGRVVVDVRALEFADGDGVAFLLNYLAYLDQGCQEDEMPPGGLAYRAKVPWQRTLAERAQASCPTLRPESPED